IALVVIFSILAAVNVVSNSLVCWIVLKHRQMKTAMNYLLINLAVSDVIVALFMTPQYVFRFTFTHPGGRAGDWLCKMITGGNFIWTGGAASAFTLVAIAIERYYAISRPHRHFFTTNHVTAIIVGSWVYAVVFNLPLFIVLEYEQKGIDFRCPEKWSSETMGKLYTVGAFFIFGAIPIGIMAVVYPLTIRALWKAKVRATDASRIAITRKRKKATRMVLAVTVLYFICWLPNLILYMLSQYRPDIYIYFDIPYVISVILVGVNSTMNPFVYSLHSTRFRDELKSLLCCSRYGNSDFLMNTL
ncbi:predicted protein, partial [Nematostella vectensis]